MFAFSILYFILNLLDLITTKIVLATSENLYELNLFYYHPYSMPLKIFAPIFLLAFYLALYHSNKSERGKRIIGISGLSSVITLMMLYAVIYANKVCQCVFVV